MLVTHSNQVLNQLFEKITVKKIKRRRKTSVGGRTDEWHSQETIRMTRTSRTIATKSTGARRSRLDLRNSGAFRLGQRSLPLGRLSKQHQSIEQ